MSWIGAAKDEKKAEAVKAPASLELAAMVSARGIAPANAVIEFLNTSECRFRTVVCFDPGDTVEFELGTPPERAYVRGSIATRTAKGPRFIYHMRLDKMSAGEIDHFAKVHAGVQRRQAAQRSQEALKHIQTTEQLHRSSMRVLAQIPVVYRTPKHSYAEAKAGNISSGGLLMICNENLVIGTPVELRFILPSEVLKAYPEETVAIDVRNATVRSSRDDKRRPFEEMTIGARVASIYPTSTSNMSYGLAFTSISGFQAEEITRYTHAVQRARNRH